MQPGLLEAVSLLQCSLTELHFNWWCMRRRLCLAMIDKNRKEEKAVYWQDCDKPRTKNVFCSAQNKMVRWIISLNWFSFRRWKIQMTTSACRAVWPAMAGNAVASLCVETLEPSSAPHGRASPLHGRPPVTARLPRTVTIILDGWERSWNLGQAPSRPRQSCHGNSRRDANW